MQLPQDNSSRRDYILWKEEMQQLEEILAYPGIVLFTATRVVLDRIKHFRKKFPGYDIIGDSNELAGVSLFSPVEGEHNETCLIDFRDRVNEIVNVGSNMRDITLRIGMLDQLKRSDISDRVRESIINRRDTTSIPWYRDSVLPYDPVLTNKEVLMFFITKMLKLRMSTTPNSEHSNLFNRMSDD
jgi:hypothetical protein